MLNLNCIICAELFKHSDDVHVTTCGHMFHYTCLIQWMERSKTCPQCRNKCTDRNIFRVYFNLANLDVSHIDVGSLQEQLDNADLKLKIKEQELNKVEEKVKSLKDAQKKCMKTITGLEQKLQKNDFILLSYTEQIKMLKADANIADDLRKEVKSLKQQIETMEGVSAMLTASKADCEKLLKNETDPKKLALWVATFKRELRISESKRNDLRNLLKVVQSNLRKEQGQIRIYEERISQLESDNYQLNEKIKTLESDYSKSPKNAYNSETAGTLLLPAKRDHKRLTISPTTKDNIKKIEESNSPYLNIKSSSIGLVPLFKRNREPQAVILDGSKMTSTTNLTTSKISPIKTGASGAVRKTSSDLCEKYSIFKKPRMGLAASNPSSAGTAGLAQRKPLPTNFAFNGFGGSEKLDPFSSRNSDDELSEEVENVQRAQKQLTSKAVKGTTFSKPSSSGLSNRLKTGGLRNFKITK